MLRSCLSQISLIAAFVALSTTSAWAYLDPGTGSMLLQGLIAGIAGGLVTIRLYWDRLKAFFAARRNGRT